MVITRLIIWICLLRTLCFPREYVMSIAYFIANLVSLVSWVSAGQVMPTLELSFPITARSSKSTW